jgi:hypothetical protein
VPTPATFASFEEERVQRKQKLAGALRLFGRFGISEGVAGVAGHITARRPGADEPTLGEPVRDELPPRADHGLILVSHTGHVVE